VIVECPRRFAAADGARAVALSILLACALGPAAPARAAAAARANAAAPATTKAPTAVAAPADETARWRAHADHVEIVRDHWGIAHVYGKSDADAVFGMIYAEAEDDFSRIEHNYLISLGRLAEAEGEAAIWSDLRARLFIDPRELEREFAKSPPWLKELMTAWADGLNYYLVKHPETVPKVLTHFEPWMALSFTEGSIGGDIETVDLAKLREFYGKETLPPHTAGGAGSGAAPELAAAAQDRARRQLGGSNGFAIAPKLSASHHALLWINPHTSYYFRAEVQVASEQGLDVYGAVTWGQFFVYQGFNEHNGWMHTSYGGDAIDEYAETIVTKPDGLYYSYAGKLRQLRVDHVSVAFEQQGGLGRREFTVYHSHHGPIIRAEKGRWIAIKLLEDPIPALEQSYLRTKTRDYASFRKIQDMRTDTSNNTVYADGDGAIAYFHGNFIPKRDPRFDYTHPVDGSDPATEWQGPTPLEDTINILNPPNGWLMNTNNWPFTAAGDASPKRENYPVYMWIKGENPRGIHALEVLKGIHDVTLDRLIAAGYDPHLPAFDALLPPLFADFERLPSNDRRRLTLAEPIEELRRWDRRTGADSVPTSLAIFWGDALLSRKGPEARDADEPVYDYLIGHLTAAERIDALDAAVAKLKRDFGRWRTPWGNINRYQRLTDDIVQPFDDEKPSLPVGFASSNWGALASFSGPTVRSTKKIYGTDGNSFIAAVEFGPTVRAKALMSGGESGHPDSPHFTDQAVMFTQGKFRDVPFTRADVKANAERTYRP
jgi:acyl-homoserine-lactone acylase